MWIMSCLTTSHTTAEPALSSAEAIEDLHPMTNNAQPRDPILSEAEVATRMRLLARLQDALRARGVSCALARRHRLVLRYNQAPVEKSGLIDPQLRAFTTGRTDVVSTDGSVFWLVSGDEFPVSDPGAAAEFIARAQRAASPA